MEEAILLPGNMTVNEAEYTGCTSGLEAAIMMAKRHSLPRFCLKVFGDSKLVIGQVNGTKMVDKEHLEPLLAKVRQHTTALLHRQCELTFAWKKRAENKEADAQCNKAMDENMTTFSRTPDFVTHMGALALGTAAHIFPSAHDGAHRGPHTQDAPRTA